MPRKYAVRSLQEQAIFTATTLLFKSAKGMVKYASLLDAVDPQLKRVKIISVGQEVRQYFDFIITAHFQNKISLFCLKTLVAEFGYEHLNYSYGHLVEMLAETILNVTDLSDVSFSDFPLNVHETLFRHLSCMSNLRYLNIRDSHSEFPRFVELLNQGLLNMPHLEEFLFENCTDSIIERIALNCKRIWKIDVTGSKEVTNACIPALCLCEDLVDFQFYFTAITNHGYEKLLMHHPRLGTIDLIFLEQFAIIPHYWTFETDQEIHYFESSTIYMEDKTLNTENLRELSSMHPHIICLHVSLEVHNQLSILRWFPNVQIVQITSYDCENFFDNLHDALKVQGSAITALNFVTVLIDLNTLLIINKYCPNIIDLQFYQSCIVSTTPIKELRSEKFKSFQSILEISVTMHIQQFDTDAARVFMKVLLSYCTNVESIFISGFEFDDELLREILFLNPMKQLEKLIIDKSYLTMNSVNLLMEHCDNLWRLQNLETWNIKLEEIKNFIFHLKRNNIHLVTRYYNGEDIDQVQEEYQIQNINALYALKS